MLIFSALDTLAELDLRTPAFRNGFKCSGVTIVDNGSIDDGPAPLLPSKATCSSVMVADEAIPS